MAANFSPMPLNHLAAWDMRENKIFENCLLEIPDLPERWEIIARCIPGKLPKDVRVHYEALLFDVWQIDSGMIEPPSYPDETVALGLDELGPSRIKRKRTVHWTKDEHRLFLIGLERYGKGDWRNISKHVVVSKTPSQVANYAQIYFHNHSVGGKKSNRWSIFDITTTSDSLTTSTKPNLSVPDQTNVQRFQTQKL